MDYIRIADTPLSYTLQIIGLVLIVAAIVDWLFSSKLTGFFRGLAAIVGVGLIFASAIAPLALWDKQILAEVKETYGVELTKEQLDELDYPVGELEDGFERYGSTVLTEPEGKGYSEETITLIRDDGKILLVSAGDRELLPLDDEAR
jgi:hypothetical protein